jgi:hypothetical protein
MGTALKRLTHYFVESARKQIGSIHTKGKGLGRTDRDNQTLNTPFGACG